MAEEMKSVKFQVTMPQELADRFLAWRKARRDYLASATAIRMMIERVLDEDEEKRRES